MSIRIFRTRALAAAVAVVACSITGTSARADTVVASNNFETPGTYDLLEATSSTISTSMVVSHSPNTSVQFNINADADQSAVRITVPATALKNISGSFWGYVQSGSSTLAPYMYLGVDTNGNGVWDGSLTDALVLAFDGGAVPSSFLTKTWFQSGIDANTNVHVVGDRGVLASGAYTSSGSQDTLAHLSNETYSGSTTWGDLKVIRAYVGAGEWPGATGYTAFADDMTISSNASAAAAPLPSAAWAGLGLMGCMGATQIRRRRVTTPR
jgi:hypothetical protein